MEHLVGIVTVLFNSDTVLPGFFESLSKQEGVRFNLYMIDNSPKDTGTRLSRNLSANYGINAKFVYNGANLGVAKGNNQGIELALADGCDLVLLANNDTEFDSATIRCLQDSISDGNRAAVPKIMYYDRPDVIWYAGGHINRWLMLTPHYGMGDHDHGQFDEQRYVGYAPTCFMMFDAKVFKEVGCMDEQYFVYYDDTDFVWRMNVHGIRIRFVPFVRVLHKVSSSTGGRWSAFSLYYGNRNRIYFIRKNLKFLEKIVSLSYVLGSRPLRFLPLPWALARSAWKGVFDGFRLNVANQ